MIYDTIKFEADPFSYFLEFADRITLVRGDSATGKTYLYQMLEDLRMTKEYQAIKLFNYKTEDFHENLKKCKDRFVVPGKWKINELLTEMGMQGIKAALYE